MLLTLYSAAMRLSTPFLLGYLERRQRLGKEDPARKHERRGRPMLPRPQRRLIWCHAASVGESLSLLAVVNRIVAYHPDAAVMVTTGTVTSARLMAERLPPGAFHQYIPVDHPAWVASFLDYWKPDIVLWTESELWPNMLRAVARRKIPAVLLNARMSQESYARWSHVKSDAREVLGAFSLCLAQNAAEAERLTQLGAGNVRVTANLKYAAASLPYDASALSALQGDVAGRPVLLWASTHAGEEEMAAELHRSLAEKFSDLLTIILPRHPKRGAAIVAATGGLLRSESASIPRDCGIYIADTLGETGLFYRLCRHVVMGGSFADIGGHNPIEPAQSGCVVFFGPYTYNFITILDDFRSCGAVIDVKDKQDLLQKVSNALENPAAFDAAGMNAKRLADDKAKVVDEIMAALSGYLGKAAA